MVSGLEPPPHAIAGLNNKTNTNAPTVFLHREQQMVMFRPLVVNTISRTVVIVAPSLE